MNSNKITTSIMILGHGITIISDTSSVSRRFNYAAGYRNKGKKRFGK